MQLGEDVGICQLPSHDSSGAQAILIRLWSNIDFKVVDGMSAIPLKSPNITDNVLYYLIKMVEIVYHWD